jgi:hypothetical protein
MFRSIWKNKDRHYKKTPHYATYNLQRTRYTLQDLYVDTHTRVAGYIRSSVLGSTKHRQKKQLALNHTDAPASETQSKFLCAAWMKISAPRAIYLDVGEKYHRSIGPPMRHSFLSNPHYHFSSQQFFLPTFPILDPHRFDLPSPVSSTPLYRRSDLVAISYASYPQSCAVAI